jgi:lysozyme
MKSSRLALFAATSMSLALASCDSSPEGSDGEHLGEAESAMKICPGASTVRGIDVSVWQETIDWNQVAASGVKFGIARVSYGTGTMDTQFQNNWDGMKQAGLIRGVYQWLRPGQDIQAQADIVINAVGMLGPGDLPAMADVEEAGSLTKAQYAAKVQQWLDLVEAGTGKRPMIYTGKYFWDGNVASPDFKQYPLVHAQYMGSCYSSTAGFVAADDCWTGSCPTISDAFDDWQFWQYSSQTHVPGISKYDYVDMDLFNGDEVALALLAGSAYGAEVVNVDMPPTAAPGQTVTAHVTMKNVGVASWDAATKLGTTGPRDHKSDLAAPDWEGGNRAAHVLGSVAPGDTFTFDVSLLAPAAVGTYSETFGMVEEQVAWFADQAGPADDAVKLTLQVVDAGGSTSASTGGTTTTGAGTGGGGSGADGAADDGCGCRVTSTDEHGGRAALLLGAMSLGLVAQRARRRRRR